MEDKETTNSGATSSSAGKENTNNDRTNAAGPVESSAKERGGGKSNKQQQPSRRGNHRNRSNGDVSRPPQQQQQQQQQPKQQQLPHYHIAEQRPDEKLGPLKDDPRGDDPTKRITKKASNRGNGRNTESFDPASTLVRPDLRVHVGSGSAPKFNRPLKHDDVVIVPELFGAEDDWTIYYKLVEEMREIQASSSPNDKTSRGAEWIPWHEGAHLISRNPKGSPTFNSVIDKLCSYFNIRKQSIGTRFNWYRDSSDWKPFHHDSAAFNPSRARDQNITVGVSFGAMRELAFIHATEKVDGEKVRVYFPQPNNGVFSFGRDANILWKHGVNALPPEQQDGKGRISVILWGVAQDVIEESNSPPLLGSDGKGPHASNRGGHESRGGGGHHHRGGGRQRNNRGSRRDRGGSTK